MNALPHRLPHQWQTQQYFLQQSNLQIIEPLR